MASKNFQRGLFRLCVVLAVAWVIGMGLYQYRQAKKVEESGVTIELSKGTQLHFDANGIRKTEKTDMQIERLALVFVPSLLLLLVAPVGAWLARGFKQEAKP